VSYSPVGVLADVSEVTGLPRDNFEVHDLEGAVLGFAWPIKFERHYLEGPRPETFDPVGRSIQTRRLRSVKVSL
jgi:hypothetical protein